MLLNLFMKFLINYQKSNKLLRAVKLVEEYKEIMSRNKMPTETSMKIVEGKRLEVGKKLLDLKEEIIQIVRDLNT